MPSLPNVDCKASNAAVEVPVIGSRLECGTDRQLVGERNVHHAEQPLGVVVAELHFGGAGTLVDGTVRDDVDGSRSGVAPITMCLAGPVALRPGRHRRNTPRAPCDARCRRRPHAAPRYSRAAGAPSAVAIPRSSNRCPGTVGLDLHARDEHRQIGQRTYVLRFENIAGYGCHGHRRLKQRLLASLGGDDDFLDTDYVFLGRAPSRRSG